MIDDLLFQRGHINVRIDKGNIGDYDMVIPDYYFENILGLTGEVVESNGSQYELHDLNQFDEFDISFLVEPVEFETDSGHIVSFENLVVRCTGILRAIDGGDVLDIYTYKVTDIS